jgi:TP901 family phage tail tape measure protein
MASGVAADLLVHVGADVKDAIGGLNRVDNSVQRAGGGFGKAGLLMGGASLAIVGGLGAAINSAANFESAIDQVTALGGDYAAQQERIAALALEIGQKTTFSATEGAMAITELAKAGVNVEDILGGAAVQAAALAEAGGQSIPEAATTMSNAMNIFGIAGKDAQMVADSFAAAAVASSSDVADLAMAMNQGGLVASSWGLSLNEANTALAVFSNNGLKGSDAGTSFKAMLNSLTPQTEEQADALAMLGISAQGFTDAADPMQYLTEQLTAGMEGMSVAQRNATLETIFGTDGMRAAIALLETGPEAYANMTKEVNRQGAAQELAAAKMGNLKGAIEQLKGSFETALILIGTAFIPVMTKVASGVTKALNGFLKLPKPIQKAGGIIAAAAAGFLALSSAIALVIAFGGPILAVMTALAAPILLIVGAVAALYLAWKTNFLGIQDIVKDVFGAIMDVGRPLIEFLGSVAKGGQVTGKAMEAIPEPFQKVATVLGIAVKAFREFYEVLAGGGGINDALAAFGKIISGGEMLDALGALGGQILSAFSNIDWGAVGSTLLAGLITAAGLIGDAAVWLTPYLVDIGSALGGWFWEQASSVDWGGLLGSAIGAIGSLASKIIETAGELGPKIKAWYDNAINSVDWGNLGFIVGEKVGDLTRTLAPKITEMINGAVTWLQENWKTVAIALGALFLGMPATIVYLGATLLPKAAEFLGGFVTGLGINWQSVIGWITDNFWKLPLLIPYLAYMLAPKAWELIKGLLDALPGAFVGVAKWLGTVGPLAFAAVGDLATKLVPRGIELFVGLWTGILQIWDTLADWLGTIGNLASSAVGSLLEYLTGRGRQLFEGLETAAGNKWDKIVEWLNTIGTLASGAVGDLGGILKGAGLALMQGLYDGIAQKWEDVKALVGSMKGWIEENKGPIQDDRRLLIPAGTATMEGFLYGIESMMPKIESALTGFTWDIPDFIAPQTQRTGRYGAAITPSGGASTIVQHIAVSVNLTELEEMVEAGRFVSQLNGTRTLYKGAPAGGYV